MINNISDEDLQAEYIPINQCFLKKIKYSDNSYSNYKYGIRLQRGEFKSELFTENSDTFNKWHDEIKRYCILPKFSKKYKALTKLKVSAVLPNSAAFFKCFKYKNKSLKATYCFERFAKWFQLIAILMEKFPKTDSVIPANTAFEQLRNFPFLIKAEQHF